MLLTFSWTFSITWKPSNWNKERVKPQHVEDRIIVNRTLKNHPLERSVWLTKHYNGERSTLHTTVMVHSNWKIPLHCKLYTVSCIESIAFKITILIWDMWGISWLLVNPELFTSSKGLFSYFHTFWKNNLSKANVVPPFILLMMIYAWNLLQR